MVAEVGRESRCTEEGGPRVTKSDSEGETGGSLRAAVRVRERVP